MIKRAIALSGTATLGLLSASGLAQQSASDGPSAAEAGWREIAQCARIGSAGQRHECLDDVIRRAGLLDPQREAEAARQEFGDNTPARTRRPEPEVRPIPRSPAPPATAAAAAPAQSAPAPAANDGAAAEPESLKTTVRAAQLSGNRRLTVVTEEGAVWEQTQSDDLRIVPKPGDAFEIQRAALGSYRCKIERSTIYRCRRVD